MPRYQVLAVTDISKPQSGHGIDSTNINGRLIDVDEEDDEMTEESKKKNFVGFKASGKRCLKFMLAQPSSPHQIIPAFEYEELPIPISTFNSGKSIFLDINNAENDSGFLLLTPRNTKLSMDNIPPSLPRLSEVQVDDDFFMSDNVIIID